MICLVMLIIVRYLQNTFNTIIFSLLNTVYKINNSLQLKFTKYLVRGLC